MKRFIFTLFVSLSLTVAAFANDEIYKTWSFEGHRISVRVSSPDSPVTIRKGEAKIPIYVSSSHDVNGMIVFIDFLKNGRSVTDGSGMAGCLKGSPGSYYLFLQDAKVYYSSLVDGQYKIIILTQPEY